MQTASKIELTMSSTLSNRSWKSAAGVNSDRAEAVCSKYAETVQRISTTIEFEKPTVPMIMLHF